MNLWDPWKDEGAFVRVSDKINEHTSSGAPPLMPTNTILEIVLIHGLELVHGLVHTFQSLDHRMLEWSGLVQNRSSPGGLRL
jgi:hypothetical protein